MTIGELVNKVGFKVKDDDVKNVNNTFQSIKNTATKLLGTIGIGLSVAGISSFIKDSVALASEVEEMENKFNVVFQGINEEVDAWAQM